MTATFEASNEAKTQEERPCIHWGNVDIIEFDEYSDEEAKEVWYDDNELGSISCDAFHLASHPDLLSSSQSHIRGSHAEDQDSMRGLEEMTVRGSIGRLQGQASVRKAVFHEQLRQQSMGFCDPTLISIVSRAESFLDIRRALELGREDQESADEILQRVREPPNVAPSTKSSPKEKSRIRGCAKHARMSVGRRMMRFFGRRKV
jgi:hypothetical protein